MAGIMKSQPSTHGCIWVRASGRWVQGQRRVSQLTNSLIQGSAFQRLYEEHAHDDFPLNSYDICRQVRLLKGTPGKLRLLLAVGPLIITSKGELSSVSID